MDGPASVHPRLPRLDRIVHRRARRWLPRTNQRARPISIAKLWSGLLRQTVPHCSPTLEDVRENQIRNIVKRAQSRLARPPIIFCTLMSVSGLGGVPGEKIPSANYEDARRRLSRKLMRRRRRQDTG